MFYAESLKSCNSNQYMAIIVRLLIILFGTKNNLCFFIIRNHVFICHKEIYWASLRISLYKESRSY